MGDATPELQLLDRFDGCIRESIPVVGEFILPKHLKDLGKDRETFTMDDVDELTEKVLRAVEFCAGADMAKEIQGRFRKIVKEENGGGT